MDPLPPLPPPLQQKIDQAVTHVYQQAFDALYGPDDLRCLEYISYTAEQRVLMRVREAIASAKREQNRRLSLQKRLPPEVWCGVWQHLSFSDRIAVTHVCSAWRDLAINAPTLWKHLEFYTTRHSLECYCTYCKDDLDFEECHSPGWESTSYSEDCANITSAGSLLSRSRELGLYVTVLITPCQVREDDLAALAHTLSGTASHRLRGLVLRTADLNAPFAFLDEFRALPMLSSLSVETLPIPEPGRAASDESVRHYACIPDGLSLPRLEDLSLSARFIVLAPSQRYPTVRTLAFEPTQHPESELRLALEVCPNVSRLTLNLGSVSSGAQQVPDDPKWWLERAPRSLRAVTVTGVPEACGRWIRAVFPPALPSLSLEYSSPRALATGGSILCDLGSDIHLSVSQTAGVLSVRGVDPGGARTRSISVCVQYQLPIDILLAIFMGGLSGHWQRVTAISADASLWPLLVALFLSTGAGMRIKTLCLAIGRRVRTPASSQGLPQPRSLARSNSPRSAP